MKKAPLNFEDMQNADRRAERRILWGEIALLVTIGLASFSYLRLTA